MVPRFPGSCSEESRRNLPLLLILTGCVPLSSIRKTPKTPCGLTDWASLSATAGVMRQKVSAASAMGERVSKALSNASSAANSSTGKYPAANASPVSLAPSVTKRRSSYRALREPASRTYRLTEGLWREVISFSATAGTSFPYIQKIRPRGCARAYAVPIKGRPSPVRRAR